MSAPPVYGQPQQNGYGPPQQQPQYGPPPTANGGQPLGSPVQQAGSDDSAFFDGASGSPSLSWGKGKGFGEWKGGIYTGVIAERQSKNYDTKKPEFWESGDPMLDVVVELLSPDRDANNPLDDGRRRLFVPKRDTNVPDSMHSVVKEATRNGLHRGGQLWVCKVGTRRGEKNDRIVWAAQYAPPTPETLAILDRMPPQGISQAGADSAQQAAQQEQSPFVGQQQAPPQHQQPAAPPQYGQQGPPAYGPPAGTPAGQVPSYAGAPAASNQPQWGPAGPQGQAQQYPPTNGQPQYPGPVPPAQPTVGAIGYQQQQGYPQGSPADQAQQYQQGAPAQTHNPYAQYQQ